MHGESDRIHGEQYFRTREGYMEKGEDSLRKISLLTIAII